MRVVVAGASGFIGKNLLLRAPKSWEIVAIYNKAKDFPDFVASNKLTNVKTAQCDLSDTNQTRSLANDCSEFDACIFLAANGDPTYSTTDPAGDLKSTTLTLLNFIKDFDVRRFIYLSSGAVYDGLDGLVSPDSTLRMRLPYAISHLASENYVRAFSSEYVVLRFFGAYGSYEPERKIYTRLIRSLYFEKESTFSLRGDGHNYIDAMYVDDAIEGILKVVVSDKKNLTVDFCSGRKLTLDQLVQEVASILDRKVRIVHKGETAEPIRFWALPKEMQDLFGFFPKISLEEGLAVLLKHLESRDKHWANAL